MHIEIGATAHVHHILGIIPLKTRTVFGIRLSALTLHPQFFSCLNVFMLLHSQKSFISHALISVLVFYVAFCRLFVYVRLLALSLLRHSG